MPTVCNAPLGRSDVEVRAVGDVEVAVVADRQIQRPVQAARQHCPGVPAGEDLGDLAGEVRDEQPAVDEGAVVQAGIQLGQHGLLAGARIDAQHLAAGHLGGDDEARPRRTSPSRARRDRRQRVSAAPPSGSMRQISLAPITGKYSRPSGPTSIALGDGTFSSSTRGSPPFRSSSRSRPPSRHSPMNSRPR